MDQSQRAGGNRPSKFDDVTASWASSEASRRSMQSNRGRDTAPERAVRRLLFAAGLRYRVDFAPLGGRRRADIVFPRIKVAIFVDGCFWHSCPAHYSLPTRNASYWLPKLARNVERDRETDALLRAVGWKVLRYWEHESAESVATSIIAHVAAPPAAEDH